MNSLRFILPKSSLKPLLAGYLLSLLLPLLRAMWNLHNFIYIFWKTGEEKGGVLKKITLAIAIAGFLVAGFFFLYGDLIKNYIKN